MHHGVHTSRHAGCLWHAMAAPSCPSAMTGYAPRCPMRNLLSRLGR
jgi:hypothetical protein